MAVVGAAAANITGSSLLDNGVAAGLPTVSVKPAAGGHGSLAMKESKVYRAHGVGVQISDGCEASIVKCSICKSTKAGVAAKAAGKLQLLQNEISDGASAGLMLLQPGAGATIKDNTLCANTKAAIQVSDGAVATIHSNHLLDGKGAGIYLFNGAIAHVLHNRVRNCAGPGIKVEKCSPQIQRNTFCHGEGKLQRVCSTLSLFRLGSRVSVPLPGSSRCWHLDIR